MTEERRRQDPTDMILREMDRMHKEHREDQRATQAGITDLRVDVAGLKVKAGIWGAIAGIIPAGLVAFWLVVKGKLSGGG